MPHREFERQLAVNRFLNLKFSKENELQEIVEIAAKVCNMTTALITLIDNDTQHIKFKYMFGYDKTLRQDAFCTYVVESGQLLIVPDALLDERFVSNPLVIDEPYIRFYAGAPLKTADGRILGSLCVIDKHPGMLTDTQQAMLSALAKQVIHLMDFDDSLTACKELYLEAKRSEIELRSFFESSIDLHLLLGRDFEILTFNKSWESHVKNTYGSQMERGKKMIEYINPIHLHDFYKDYSTALKGTAVFDERNLKQNGRDRWHLVKFEPAFNTNGEIIGVSVNVSDVSKKVEQERNILLKNQQLDEIAFIQSHELRRPVASILGFMEIFKEDNYRAEPDDLRMLERAAKELDSKIREIVQATQHQR